MPPGSIGVAVIARNEVDRLPYLLASAAFAHEAVVVVDDRSTDGTADLARRRGARVIQRGWPGYAAQKQFALEQIRCAWVLSLDADEVVPPPLSAAIQRAVHRAPPDVAGFSMPRLSYYLGRWIRHGGWYPDRKVRLVRRGRGRWTGDGLHERLVVDGAVAALDSPLHHFVYRGIHDQVATINRFSEVYADGRGAAAGSRFVTAGVGHALAKFLECFVWKMGWRDGPAGLVIAMNSAWYVFLKHAKAWERCLRADDRPFG